MSFLSVCLRLAALWQLASGCLLFINLKEPDTSKGVVEQWFSSLDSSYFLQLPKSREFESRSLQGGIAYIFLIFFIFDIFGVASR